MTMRPFESPNKVGNKVPLFCRYLLCLESKITLGDRAVYIRQNADD